MVRFEILLTAVVAAVGALELTDEEYHSLPNLFHLDDFDGCLASRKGAFCVGTFELMQYRNDRLLNIIQQFSEYRYHFNHTKIHRGFCIPTTCSHIEGPSVPIRFERCVNNLTRLHYGLEANLTQLEYCRTAKQQKQVDSWDLSFAYIVGVVVLMNLVGTAYDVLRNQDNKPNKQLMAWSLVVNWHRLTADNSGGDSRLSALRPVQGMKALTLILVMLAHSVLAYHLTYIYNPKFLEQSNEHVLAAYMQNGTSIVQTFIMISSFLLSYNLLIYAGDNPKKTVDLRMLPKCIMHRFSRITPIYLFIIGVATTWWAQASDGPLWAPIIEADSVRCRDKWWAHALFISNFVKVEERCLIHTWFLAVDMQLCIVSTILTLLLIRRPHAAVKVLIAMIVGTVVMNFCIIFYWDLAPMVKLMIPELMRTQFPGQHSFTWLYTAPWDSLPSALIGILVAFIHYNHQNAGFRPTESLCVRILYRFTVPCMFLWVVGGYFMKPVTEPLYIYLYAALDRPIFMTLTATAMYGFFNKIDSVWWKLLSWRGWEILGRMSLSIYLVHWLIALLLLGVRTNVSRVSVFDVGGHWLDTIFLSYWAALPLHLFIESPATKFLQSLTS